MDVKVIKPESCQRSYVGYIWRSRSLNMRQDRCYIWRSRSLNMSYDKGHMEVKVIKARPRQRSYGGHGHENLQIVPVYIL